jgi:hypothetical protein
VFYPEDGQSRFLRNAGNTTQRHIPEDINLKPRYLVSEKALRWFPLPRADVPIPLGFRTVPGLGYQIVPSYNTEPTTEILVLLIQPRHGPHRRSLFHYCVFSRYGEKFPQSCFLATAVVRSPVYTAVIWQWFYMSQYENEDEILIGSKTQHYTS